MTAAGLPPVLEPAVLLVAPAGAGAVLIAETFLRRRRLPAVPALCHVTVRRMSAGDDVKFVTGNGVRFGYLSAGEPGAPVALCLHGFPDSAHTWRHLLPRLAVLGYHAVAPFLRGYAPTEVPADGAYQLGALIADAVALPL